MQEEKRRNPKCGGLSEVGVPHPKGRANHHTTTLSPERGPKSTVFWVPSLRPPAGWLVARLLLSGDVERNPGPGKKWLCTLCSLQIKTKSQTSIRCNHTTTHWEHLTCTNITATQYTNTWKCEQHSTHITQTQPPHSKNNTNQFPPIPPQTATVACEPTPTSPPSTPATNPSKPITPQTTSPTSATVTDLPINSTPQSALVPACSACIVVQSVDQCRHCTVQCRQCIVPILITYKTKTNYKIQQHRRTYTNYNKANWLEFTQEIEQTLSNAETPQNAHTATKNSNHRHTCSRQTSHT